MNKVILILGIEFTVFVVFLIFIYRLVKRDIKRYQQGPATLPAERRLPK